MERISVVLLSWVCHIFQKCLRTSDKIVKLPSKDLPQAKSAIAPVSTSHPANQAPLQIAEVPDRFLQKTVP